jgi:hypothetical protein
LLLLVADQPEHAHQQTHEVMRRWWSGGFTRQHYNHMLGCGYAALYRGDGEAAWQVVASQRAAMRRTLMSRIQAIRIETAYLRGRSALAQLARLAQRARRRFLSIARQEARHLEREHMPWSAGFALLLRGAVACHDGHAGLAEQHLAAPPMPSSAPR